MNWFIAFFYLSSVYFIRQSFSRRITKPIHRGAPTYHYRYQYSQPRQIPVFLPPERKTIFHGENFPIEDSHSHPHNNHHLQNGWGWENESADDIFEAKEIVKFINQFLGVMGPFLFPLPYVLALLPFAIPAIPLSLWLEAREPHNPHPPGGESGHNQPQNGTTTEHSTSTSTTTPKPTTTTTHWLTSASTPETTTFLPTTMFSTFSPTETLQTTSSSEGGNANGGVTQNPGDNNSSFNSSMLGNNSFPDFGNMSIPGFNPVTLFPFTIFLNSSFLGDDYE